MSTDTQHIEHQKAVTERLEQLFSMRVREAASRPNLGEINFSDLIPLIDRTLGLFDLLRNVKFDLFSINKLKQIASTIDTVIADFKKIESFTLSVDNPRNQRDTISNEIRNNYNKWFDMLFPLIGSYTQGSADLFALERDLRSKISQAEEIAKELLEQQQQAAEEAQATLATIQKAAAQAGVSQEAVHFKREADEHKSASRRWLAATAVVALLTLTWGGWVLWGLTVPTGTSWPQILQQSLGKLIVLSGLYYALVWCARNYSATRHNFIVNRHRQNALSTFETFAKAAGSDDVKEAVLLQATTSIFSAQPSGYTGKQSDAEQPSKVIEILRGVGSISRAGGTT